MKESSLGATVSHFLKKIDFLASTVPQFNLGGRGKIGSVIGGLMTIALSFLLAFYALVKF